MKKSTAIVTIICVLLLCVTAVVMVLLITKKPENNYTQPIATVEPSTEPTVVPTTEPTIEPTIMPELIPLVTVTADLKQAAGDEFYEKHWTMVGPEKVQEYLDSIYTFTEPIEVSTVDVSVSSDYCLVQYHIDATDCVVVFESMDGGTNWYVPILLNYQGTDYAPIICDNGIPSNWEEVYCCGTFAGDLDKTLLRTDYKEGDEIINIRDRFGNTTTVSLDLIRSTYFE